MKGTLAQELDFENEAKNAERCFSELRHFPFVYVPNVFWNLTSKVSDYYIFQILRIYTYAHEQQFIFFWFRFGDIVAFVSRCTEIRNTPISVSRKSYLNYISKLLEMGTTSV